MWETVFEPMIGTFAGGVAGMVKLSSLGADDFTPPISEGSFTIDPAHRSILMRTGEGLEVEQGWLQCGWHINGLRGNQYDELEDYKSGRSTKVYIRSLDNDGKTWKNYLAVMLFPVKPVRGDPTAVESGAVFDFELRFIQLVEQV